MTARVWVIVLLLLHLTGCSESVSAPQAETGAQVGHPIVGGWEGQRTADIIYFRDDGTGYVGESSDRKAVRTLEPDPPAGTSAWRTREFRYHIREKNVDIRFENGRKLNVVLARDGQSLDAFGRSFSRVPESQDDIELRSHRTKRLSSNRTGPLVDCDRADTLLEPPIRNPRGRPNNSGLNSRVDLASQNPGNVRHRQKKLGPPLPARARRADTSHLRGW